MRASTRKWNLSLFLHFSVFLAWELHKSLKAEWWCSMQWRFHQLSKTAFRFKFLIYNQQIWVSFSPCESYKNYKTSWYKLLENYKIAGMIAMLCTFVAYYWCAVSWLKVPESGWRWAPISWYAGPWYVPCGDFVWKDHKCISSSRELSDINWLGKIFEPHY